MTDFKDRLDAVYGAGGDAARLKAVYDDWAEKYDAELWASGNPYVAIICALVGRFVPDPGARILDGGCGTGAVGRILSCAGYANIEGLDPSDGMRAAAARRGVYAALYPLALGAEIALEKESYDAVVASGVLTVGHAPPEALDGMLGLAKRGAPILFSMSKPAFEDSGFGAKIAALDAAGAWRAEHRSPEFQTYPFLPEYGHYRHWISVYRKN